MLWANLAEIDMAKLKKNQELRGMVTKKNPGIRKSGK